MHRFLVTGAVSPPTLRFLPIALFLLPTPASAMEIAMSHRDLVTDSDIIVVATLKNIEGRMQNGYYLEEGGLHVERVLCGDAKPGDVLPLRWQNYPNVACPRVEHARNANQPRIWFLERDDKGLLGANTNQRAWPVEFADTFLDTMAAYPYHVVTPGYDIGQPVIVTVEFRNATARPISVPTVRVEHGRVTHSNGFGVVFPAPRRAPSSNGTAQPTANAEREFEYHVRPGSLELDESLERMTLEPGETARAELSFSDLLGEIPVGLHRFEVRVDGQRSNHGVRVRSEWAAGLARVSDTPREIPYLIQTIRAGGPASFSSIMALELRASGVSPFADELMAMSDSLETRTRLQVMRLIAWLDVPPETRMDYGLERIDCAIAEVRAAAGSSVTNVLWDAAFDCRREEATALLMSLLDDEDPIVRRSAVSALCKAHAAVALPALKMIARYDRDLEIRREARRAVDILEGRNPCSFR